MKLCAAAPAEGRAPQAGLLRAASRQATRTATRQADTAAAVGAAGGVVPQLSDQRSRVRDNCPQPAQPVHGAAPGSPDAEAILTVRSIWGKVVDATVHNLKEGGMAVLEDKVAVVTGASIGIGFATARAFRDEGATVFITGRRKDALDAAVAELGPGVTGVVCDASVPSELDAFYSTVRDQAGRIDVLVANSRRRHRGAARRGDGRSDRLGVRHQRQGSDLHSPAGTAAAQYKRFGNPDGFDRCDTARPGT